MQPHLSIDEWLDVGHAGHFLNQFYEQAVFARMKRLGFGDVRTVHGYVVQRLVDGPRSVSSIARDLEVSQQAVSKWLAELTDMGLVVIALPGRDARERRVQLSTRGRHCLRVSREARAAVTKKLEAKVGTAEVARVKRSLARMLQALGGLERVYQRRVPVPRAHLGG